jgi:hypothetical protein
MRHRDIPACAIPKGADPRLVAASPVAPGRRLSLCAAGAIAALLTGSRVIRGDIDMNPNLPFSGALYAAASHWQDAMDRAGLTGLDAWLHRAIRKAQSASW